MTFLRSLLLASNPVDASAGLLVALTVALQQVAVYSRFI